MSAVQAIRNRVMSRVMLFSFHRVWAAAGGC
jgi:hypothetical protein